MSDKPDTRRVKDRNRAIRQDALREQLAAKGLVQHVIEIAQKLADDSIDMDNNTITRLKHSADLKLKLVNKYLPDLKAVEMTGPEGEEIKLGMAIMVVGQDVASAQDSDTE